MSETNYDLIARITNDRIVIRQADSHEVVLETSFGAPYFAAGLDDAGNAEPDWEALAVLEDFYAGEGYYLAENRAAVGDGYVDYPATRHVWDEDLNQFLTVAEAGRLAEALAAAVEQRASDPDREGRPSPSPVPLRLTAAPPDLPRRTPPPLGSEPGGAPSVGL